MIINNITALGAYILHTVKTMGKAVIFAISGIFCVFSQRARIYKIFEQIIFVGAKSSFIVALTGMFTGMVLALQGYYALNKFGATAMLGPTVALSLIRELGPVLAALMISARVGTALTAEIGTMRVTEQIDALEIMGINPHSYLIFPNMLAGIISFPILTTFFDLAGIWGGYLVAVDLLNLSEGTYFGQMSIFVTTTDIYNGIIKSLCFATIVMWVSLFMGYTTYGGSKGVSKATRQAVVMTAIQIFLWDYILTSFLNL